MLGLRWSLGLMLMGSKYLRYVCILERETLAIVDQNYYWKSLAYYSIYSWAYMLQYQVIKLLESLLLISTLESFKVINSEPPLDHYAPSN